jgi:hypothetical protein
MIILFCPWVLVAKYSLLFSNHDVLAGNKERNCISFSFFSVSVNYFYQYPFIYSSYYPKEGGNKEIIQNIYRYIVENIKKRTFLFNYLSLSETYEPVAKLKKLDSNDIFLNIISFHFILLSFFFCWSVLKPGHFSGSPSKLVPHFLVHSYSSANSMHV